MPSKSKKLCAHTGCKNLTTERYCEEHSHISNERRRQSDKLRKPNEKRPHAAARGYNYRWQKYRLTFLAKNPLCVRCLETGVITPGTVVDHIIPHMGDYEAFWDEDNHQTLCKTCHDLKTLTEDGYGNINPHRPNFLKASAIPLTIVCGPPGSGKTKYVNDHKQPGDIVIDLDEIKSKLSGLPWYEAGEEWLMRALEERNRQLASLALEKGKSAWFILSAANVNYRRWWKGRLCPVRTVVLEIRDFTCKQRLKADERRLDLYEEFSRVVDHWWREYRRDNLDDREIYESE